MPPRPISRVIRYLPARRVPTGIFVLFGRAIRGSVREERGSARFAAVTSAGKRATAAYSTTPAPTTLRTLPGASGPHSDFFSSRSPAETFLKRGGPYTMPPGSRAGGASAPFVPPHGVTPRAGRRRGELRNRGPDP